ncbi:MAG: site-2 protease family protein [Rhizobiales bacterium]|nr:site-2 protease family protein [Hyphomicrobiales bacterium]
MELLNTITGFGGSMFQYIFGFISVLMVIVFVHEMGHFIVARWCNVRIEAFSVGFGRELLGYTDKKNTRWKLCLIPLGGYVKFWGDNGAASFADGDALKNMSVADREVCFQTKPLWKKSAVVVAGPIANFIFSIAIFTTFLMVYGQPFVLPKVDAVSDGGAAQIAGIQKNDIIIAYGNNDVDSFADLQKNVMFSANKTSTITVTRGDKILTLTITPKKFVFKDKFGDEQTIGRIGIVHQSSAEERTFKTLSLPSAVYSSVGEVGFIIKQSLIAIKDLVIGQGDVKQLGGPVKIAQYSGNLASEGILPLIRLAALLSIGIGLFNLFPIPMLDGGHLVFYFIESIIGRPLPPKYMEYAMRVGITLLLGFFIFVTVNDIGSIVQKLT